MIVQDCVGKEMNFRMEPVIIALLLRGSETVVSLIYSESSIIR